MIMLDPEHNECNHPEGAVALGALVVAGGQGAALLAATNQVLHPVAPPVARPIKRAAAALVGLARDGRPDAATAARLADSPAAVAFVGGHAPGPPAGPPAAGPAHRALGQQLREHRRLVRLAGREHPGHGLATALGAEMDLGGEPALAAPEGLGRGVPPFAPAACWCARITVPSTKCSSQSSAPAASAWRWTAARSWSQTPARVQRRKRVYTVCQGPYRSGKSRQGTPVASFQRIPLSSRRSSCRGRPGFRGGKSGCKRAHSVSLNSCRCRILHLQEHTDSQHNYRRSNSPFEDRP